MDLDHALYCPLKNAKSALFFVGYFLFAVLAGWIGLHRVPAPRDPIILCFAFVFMAIFLKAMVDFGHWRERCAFGLAIVLFAVAQVERYAPSVFGQHLWLERYGRLALGFLGLLICLSMLIQSWVQSRP